MLRQHDATMIDYEAEWNQIWREERRVREELTNAQPGNPILGPVNPLQAAPLLPTLPFEVMTPRYGTVYHTPSMVHQVSNRCSPDWQNSWAWICSADQRSQDRFPHRCDL